MSGKRARLFANTYEENKLKIYEFELNFSLPILPFI